MNELFAPPAGGVGGPEDNNDRQSTFHINDDSFSQIKGEGGKNDLSPIAGNPGTEPFLLGKISNPISMKGRDSSLPGTANKRLSKGPYGDD